MACAELIDIAVESVFILCRSKWFTETDFITSLNQAHLSPSSRKEIIESLPLIRETWPLEHMAAQYHDMRELILPVSLRVARILRALDRVTPAPASPAELVLGSIVAGIWAIGLESVLLDVQKASRKASLTQAQNRLADVGVVGRVGQRLGVQVEPSATSSGLICVFSCVPSVLLPTPGECAGETAATVTAAVGAPAEVASDEEFDPECASPPGDDYARLADLCGRLSVLIPPGVPSLAPYKDAFANAAAHARRVLRDRTALHALRTCSWASMVRRRRAYALGVLLCRNSNAEECAAPECAAAVAAIAANQQLEGVVERVRRLCGKGDLELAHKCLAYIKPLASCPAFRLLCSAAPPPPAPFTELPDQTPSPAIREYLASLSRHQIAARPALPARGRGMPTRGGAMPSRSGLPGPGPGAARPLFGQRGKPKF